MLYSAFYVPFALISKRVKPFRIIFFFLPDSVLKFAVLVDRWRRPLTRQARPQVPRPPTYPPGWPRRPVSMPLLADLKRLLDDR